MKIESMDSACAMGKQLFVALVIAGLLAGCASSGQKDTDTSAFDPADDTGAVASGFDDAATVDGVEDDVAVVLDNVFYFEFDQSTLTSSARAALDAQAAALRGGNSAIRLEGHADERGSREYNLALGERRAKAVADYLAIQGVSRSRIEAISYGEERPISLNSNEAGWAQNRRVELK